MEVEKRSIETISKSDWLTAFPDKLLIALHKKLALAEGEVCYQYLRRHRGANMGFRFRRTVRILPGVKINLSGSGASVSLGGRGFHYTIGPKGTRVTAGIPGTGMSWTEYSAYSKPKPNAPDILDPSSRFEPIPQLAHVELEAIENASAREINAHSTSQLAPILNSASRRFAIAPVILLISLALFVASLLQANQLWLGLAVLYATVLIPLAIFLDRYRRSVKVLYDSQGVVARITEALAVAFTELSTCRSVWTIQAEGRVSDWKRNAGATGQIRRKRTKLRFDKPTCIRGRTKFPAFKFGSDALYLLPDSALVIVGGAIAAVSYRDLDFSMPTIKFIEEESVPSDTTVLDHTWRYVNKSGGPDRRFISNRQIPVCLYRELNFKSEGGLNCKFQVSNSAAADPIYKVIETLRRTTVELPQSITYVQRAKRWPTALFLLCALSFSCAQLVFLKDGLLPKSQESLFGALNTRPTTHSPVQLPSAPSTSAGQSQLIRPSSPPLDLKPQLPPLDSDRPASSAIVVANELLDLRDPANLRLVQSRLRELGFLRSGSIGWDAASRSALRDLKATNNIGNDDKWDIKTQELLMSGPALRAEQTFVGAWSEASCDPAS